MPFFNLFILLTPIYNRVLIFFLKSTLFVKEELLELSEHL